MGQVGVFAGVLVSRRLRLRATPQPPRKWPGRALERSPGRWPIPARRDRRMERIDLPGDGHDASWPPMSPDEEAAYEQHCREAEAEEAEFVRTGRRVCPKCGQRTLKVSYRPTRQYGG